MILSYLLIATVTAFISLFALVTVWMKLQNRDIVSNVSIDPTKEKDLNLSKTGLSQFKILDTKQTAQLLYETNENKSDQPGNTEAQNTYRQIQKKYSLVSNPSYTKHKEIYD